MLDGPRGARPTELPQVVNLSNRVFYPDGCIDMQRALPLVFREENAHNLRVIGHDGELVAMAGMTVNVLQLEEVALRAACIGSVCTLEAYRGRGLASALMDDAIACADSQGACLALISGTRGLYRRMGCIDGGRFRVSTVERGARTARLPCSVHPWREPDLPALEQLHAAEPVRFMRPPGEMAVLVRAQAMFCRPARTWVAVLHGRVAAYLCVSGPDDRTGPGTLLAREAAGSREAILCAAATILEAEGAQRLEVEYPHQDREMSERCDSLGLASRITGRHGTLKVIDAAALAAALAPRLHGRQVALPRGSEDLAAAVFGSTEREDPALDPGLPVPLPGYGLNYV